MPMPTKILRTYSLIRGGNEDATAVDEVKLEHVTFDMDNATEGNGTCPVCKNDFDGNECEFCGYSKGDIFSQMIEKHKTYFDAKAEWDAVDD